MSSSLTTCQKLLLGSYPVNPLLSTKWNQQILPVYNKLIEEMPLPNEIIDYILALSDVLNRFMEDKESVKKLPEPPNFSMGGGCFWNEDSEAVQMIIRTHGLFAAYWENKEPAFYEQLVMAHKWLTSNIKVQDILTPIRDNLAKQATKIVKLQLEKFTSDQKKKLFEIFEKYRQTVPQSEEKGMETIKEIEEDYGNQFINQNYIILMHFINQGLFWKKAVDKYYQYYTKKRMEDDCPEHWELQGNYLNFLLRENAARTGKRIKESDIRFEREYFTRSLKAAIDETKKRKEMHKEEAEKAEELRNMQRKEAERAMKRKQLRKKLVAIGALKEEEE